MKRKLSMALIVVAIMSLALATSPVFGGYGDVPVKPDGLENAKQAPEKHTDQLLAREGVERTAIGFNRQGRPTVVIFTANAGVQGLPVELDGVPVSVHVTGKFYPLAAPPLDAEFS